MVEFSSITRQSIWLKRRRELQLTARKEADDKKETNGEKETDCEKETNGEKGNRHREREPTARNAADGEK
jgi:hypothetical protein